MDSFGSGILFGVLFGLMLGQVVGMTIKGYIADYRMGKEDEFRKIKNIIENRTAPK